MEEEFSKPDRDAVQNAFERADRWVDLVAIL